MQVLTAPGGYVFLRGQEVGKYWLVRVEPKGLRTDGANDRLAHKLVMEHGDIIIGLDYSQPSIWSDA